MPTLITVHEWSLTRVELGGDGVRNLAAWYGVPEHDYEVLPSWGQQLLTSIQPSMMHIDLTHILQRQHDQEGCIVFNGMYLGFPDPAPLQRKCLTVVYEGENEREHQDRNQICQVLSGAFTAFSRCLGTRAFIGATFLSCTGKYVSADSATLVFWGSKLGLMTAGAAAVLGGCAGWRTSTQARMQTSLCAIAWTIPAIDLNIISEKIEEFPPHFPVATSSMQHAWEGGLMR